MKPSVQIIDEGRSGRVCYREGARSIEGYFEFGGGDVVTIINMGTASEWRAAHPWAIDRRADILAFIAKELIRQRAPSCDAEIEEARGEILLRQSATRKPAAPSQTPAKAAAFVTRFRDLREKFAAGVLVAALAVGALMWFGTNAFTVQPAHGVPLNDAARYASVEPTHPGGVAVLIQRTDPHPPRWSGRGGNDTTSIDVLIIPTDGASPRLVPLAKKLTPNAYTLARIIGSDGHTLWIDVAGLHGVRLRDFRHVTTDDLQAVNRSLPTSWWQDPRGMDVFDGQLRIVRDDRSAALAIDPATLSATPAPPAVSNARFERYDESHYLAAGVRIGPDAWLGVLSPEERSGAYRPGTWVRPVESADGSKALRRLVRARLGVASGDRRRIETVAQLDETDRLGAAFLRIDAESEPLRLDTPDSALMIHTSAPGLAGTLVVSRVSADGDLIWSVDTGLDRFRLQQILPGADVLAFVGPRLPIPDKLSEPFVVLVETKTGKITMHSLWR